MKLILAIALVALFAMTSAMGEGFNRDKVCNMCIDFITKASAEILEHEDDFRQNGGKICDVLTLGNDDLRAKCKELVNDKVDDIIRMVRESKSPQDICQSVKFCPSSD